MPTIDQLSQATSVSDGDEILVSQGGTAVKVSRATLLAGVQPQLALPSGSLLGRSSGGTGAPETLALGANLTLAAGTLSASSGPLSIAALPAGAAPSASDLIPVGQGGSNKAVSLAQLTAGLQPQLSLAPGVLIGRTSPGVGAPQPVAVGANLKLSVGTLSADAAPFTVGALPAGASPVATDLLPVSQGGVDKAVSVTQLTAGLQPQIALAPGSLLGRNSLGTGGPEPVVPGVGLQLAGGTLSATVGAFSIAQLPAGATPAAGDLLPIGQAGVNKAITVAQLTAGLQPQLTVAAGALLGRKSAGSGAPEAVAVGANLRLANGTLSGSVAPFAIASLPAALTIGAGDQVAVAQGGTNKAATISLLTAGMQPQITVGSGALLGRASPGAGAPEVIGIGQNLMMANGTLASLAAPFLINALTPAGGIGDADLLPISQNGITLQATRAQLVAGLQPTLAIGSGSLLGRSSVGTGAPESVALGANLTLSGGTLSATATPFSIATLPAASAAGGGDFLPISQNGVAARITQAQLLAGLQPQLSLPSGALLGRSGAGTGGPEPTLPGDGLTLASGTLSAVPLESLPAAGTPAATDLLLLRQRGSSRAISFQNLLGGMSTLPSIDGSHLMVTADGSIAPRSLAARLAEDYDVRDFGAVGDGSTDDTAALQAAVNAAEAVGRSLWLPPGQFVVSSLTVAGTLRMRGCGAGVTILMSKPGTTAPMLSIRLSPTKPFDHRRPVEIESLSMFGNKTDPAGAGVAHGIDFQNAASSPRYDWVILRQVQIAQFAGHGINGISWNGFAYLTNCEIFNNNLDNVHVNSCFDWVFTSCDIGQCGQDCVSISGCGEFAMFGCAIYAAGRYGVLMYDINIGSNTFVGCAIDTNNLGGLRYNNPGQGHNAFINCNFNYNGDATPNTYSDVFVTANSGAGLCLIGNRFEQTVTDNPVSGKSKYNIEFESGAAPSVTWIGNGLVGGMMAGSHFTNDATKLVISGDTSFGTSMLSGAAGWQWKVNSAPVLTVQAGNLTLQNSGAASVAFVDKSQPVNFQRFAINGGSQQLMFFSQNDDTTAHATNMELDRSGQVVLGGGYQTGSVLVKLSPATSPSSVNRVSIIGAAGGGNPVIAAGGTDAVVTLRLQGQGGGGVQVGGTGDRVGFAGAVPVAVPTISGSRGSGAALASLLTQLAGLGLIVDGSTA